MRLIGTLQGNSVLRVSPEDASPRNGVPWPELIAALNTRYKFASMPPVQSGVPAQAPAWIIFQNGEFETSGKKAAIQQLALTSGGAVVTSTSTDVSDAVLDDLVAFLDRSFEFRISSSSQKRDHISDVVVEFDRGVEDYMRSVARIEEIVSAPFSKSRKIERAYRFKRIAFGREGFDANEIAVPATSPLDGMESTEFVIERRVRHPYSDNRYFSRAPMATSEHVTALEMIEKVLGDG